jgi:hypothetical protein
MQFFASICKKKKRHLQYFRFEDLGPLFVGPVCWLAEIPLEHFLLLSLACAALVKNSIFQLLAAVLLSKHVRDSMNNAQVIHALLCFHVYGKDLTCSKHLGFSAFSVKNNGIVSDPSIFEYTSTVILSLILLPPCWLSPSKACFIQK